MRVALLVIMVAVAALATIACTTDESGVACENGDVWTEYQLFMGRNEGMNEVVTDQLWTEFLANEVTPRFPDGLTVLDANGQWHGDDDVILRERSKVLMILTPPGGDAEERINEIVDAYTAQFRQDSVLISTSESCIRFS